MKNARVQGFWKAAVEGLWGTKIILVTSNIFRKKPLGGDTRGLPGASVTAGEPITSFPLART